MNDNEAEDSKKAKREGNSARARVYRAKDELFTFTFDQLFSFKDKYDPSDDMKLIRAQLVILDENEDDEAAAAETMKLMQGVVDKLKAAGFFEKSDR